MLILLVQETGHLLLLHLGGLRVRLKVYKVDLTLFLPELLTLLNAHLRKLRSTWNLQALLVAWENALACDNEVGVPLCMHHGVE